MANLFDMDDEAEVSVDIGPKRRYLIKLGYRRTGQTQTEFLYLNVEAGDISTVFDDDISEQAFQAWQGEIPNPGDVEHLEISITLKS